MTAAVPILMPLGLTCDPVGGLVQVLRIERDAIGAKKAITAAQMARTGDPSNARVSLHNVVDTMWKTAQDMNTKYKETSEGDRGVFVGPVSLGVTGLFGVGSVFGIRSG